MTQTVLSVLADRHGARACLEAAAAAAASFPDGEVAALRVSIDPRSTILPTEEILTDVRRAEIERFEASERRHLRAVFDRVVEERGPDRFRWVDEGGTEAEAVTEHARRAVLVVLAVPRRHYAGDALEAEHAALFDSGRPLLLVPRGYRHRPIEKVTVAWHDDETCRRAIAGAEPWLRRVSMVEVVSVDGGVDAALDPVRALMASLGVKATYRAIDRGQQTVGESLLAEAVDADWLVMGAFRRGRLMDWLVGSATEVVLADMTLPVLFSH